MGWTDQNAVERSDITAVNRSLCAACQSHTTTATRTSRRPAKIHQLFTPVVLQAALHVLPFCSSLSLCLPRIKVLKSKTIKKRRKAKIGGTFIITELILPYVHFQLCVHFQLKKEQVINSKRQKTDENSISVAQPLQLLCFWRL